jgi:hypothetical protein
VAGGDNCRNVSWVIIATREYRRSGWIFQGICETPSGCRFCKFWSGSCPGSAAPIAAGSATASGSFDEAHHASADGLSQIVTLWRQRGGQLFFFTATPYRGDGRAAKLDGMRSFRRFLAEHMARWADWGWPTASILRATVRFSQLRHFVSGNGRRCNHGNSPGGRPGHRRAGRVSGAGSPRPRGDHPRRKSCSALRASRRDCRAGWWPGWRRGKGNTRSSAHPAVASSCLRSTVASLAMQRSSS